MSFTVNIPTAAQWWLYDPHKGDTRKAFYADTGGMRVVESRVGSRRHKPSGWLYPTEYHLSYGSTRNSSGNITFFPQTLRFVDGKQEWYTVTESIFGFVYVPYPLLVMPELGNLLSRAETKALLKLKDQKVNLAVALAEYQQTANFVGDVFGALGRSIQAAKKQNWKRSISELKRAYRNSTRTYVDKGKRYNPYGNKIIDKWLEWQYAASPLIQDVNGSITALAGRKDLTEWVQTVKGVVSRTDRLVTQIDTDDLNLYSADCVTETFAGVFVRLDFIPSYTFVSTLSQTGFTNPFEVAWEKTPWSFVVDWAVGVGDWLSTLDAALGYTFLSGSYTTRQSRIDRVTGSNRALNWEGRYARPVRLGQREFGGIRKSLELHRRKYSAIPRPALVIKNPVSLTHLANGLALLTSVVTGAKTRRDLISRK